MTISLNDITGTTTLGRYIVYVRGDEAERRGLTILTDWRDGMVDAACGIEHIDDAPRCEYCGRPAESLEQCEDNGDVVDLCAECAESVTGDAPTTERPVSEPDRYVGDCDVREPMHADDLRVMRGGAL